IVAAGYLLSMELLGFLDTAFYIPFASVSVEIGLLYYVPAIVLLTGIVNSVNLTDGVDGLAGTVTSIVAVFFAAAALLSGAWETVFLSSMTAGICLGFLVYNFYPARVFMGDTGSLALGGAVAVMAIFSRAVLLLPLMGACFVASTLSVILQVGSYKLRRKRIFKMAPLHHHFELLGYSETRIVSVYMIITTALCLISLLAFQ
ncbi:MAG: phospho-N-acetylmuramoyl-pentapeptide-transferase, partial [Clostridia bacterium]|nr:phospho-N-acetylmuramoyl-pentapeptide-transferase [Clostridia bacterium]